MVFLIDVSAHTHTNTHTHTHAHPPPPTHTHTHTHTHPHPHTPGSTLVFGEDSYSEEEGMGEEEGRLATLNVGVCGGVCLRACVCVCVWVWVFSNRLQRP